MLDQYVLDCKKYINNHPGLLEEEIIMYVYLDLALRFSFNPDFFFGDEKKKREIYFKASDPEELRKCFETGKVICRSAAYILEYVLKRLGVNIITIDLKRKYTEYSHVLNIIIPKDGSTPYKIDLQNDMINIHFHGFTTNFGVDVEDKKKYVISVQRQKEIHQKLGYLNHDNPCYLEEYIDLLKSNVIAFPNFYEQLDFVLQNIEPMPYPNVSYWERRWKHGDILASLFDVYDLGTKLNVAELYKIENDEYVYNNCFFVNTQGSIKVYYYSKENYKYTCYDLEHFKLKMKLEKINICPNNELTKVIDRYDKQKVKVM